MHHEDIKAAIRKQGVTPASIARHLGVTSQTVSRVIRGDSGSRRVAEAIAKICGASLAELWPGRYDLDRAPSVAALLSGRVPRRAGKAVA